MADVTTLTIHTDGASRGNPGEAAYAYVIARSGQDPIEEGGRLGMMTNNQAEYTALVKALQRARRLGPEHHLIIHSDSELMVKQMKGEYKVKNIDLKDLYAQARELVGQFKGGVVFRHVRREYNKRADELCNEALDGLREPSVEEEFAHLLPALPAALPLGPEPKVSSLYEEALSCLQDAKVKPSAEVVWQRLVDILKKHEVKLPAR